MYGRETSSHYMKNVCWGGFEKECCGKYLGL